MYEKFWFLSRISTFVPTYSVLLVDGFHYYRVTSGKYGTVGMILILIAEMDAHIIVMYEKGWFHK